MLKVIEEKEINMFLKSLNFHLLIPPLNQLKLQQSRLRGSLWGQRQID
jgi:hypothetical protein